MSGVVTLSSLVQYLHVGVGDLPQDVRYVIGVVINLHVLMTREVGPAS